MSGPYELRDSGRSQEKYRINRGHLKIPTAIFGESRMDVKQIRIEIRKHHVLPGVNVLDLIIETDEEKLVRQTQHKDGDQAFKKFVEDVIKIGKELSFARIE